MLRLATPDFLPELRRLSFINIAASLTVPLVGLIDTAMLGRLDQVHYLGGAALGALIFDFLYFGLGFLRMSTTGSTAQAVGRGDQPEIGAILGRGLAIAALLGVLILLLRSGIESLALSILDGASDVETAARGYYRARLWGAPAVLLNLVAVGWLLGHARSFPVLVITIVTNVANVVLNWLFIIRLDWAAAGAGWASALAQYLGFAAALPALALVGPKLPTWRRLLDRAALTDLLTLNGNLLLRTLCLIFAFTSFSNWSAQLGTITLAANTVLLRWLSVASYLVDGIAYATETLAGRIHGADVGAERSARLRRLAVWSVGAGQIAAVVVWAPLLVWPERAVAFLAPKAEIVETALPAVSLLVIVIAFGGLAYIFDGYFLGLTAGRLLRNSMLFALSAYLIVALPAVRTSDNTLLWIAMVTLMVARAGSLGWVLWRSTSSRTSR